MSTKQFAILAALSLGVSIAAVPASRAATSTAAVAVSAIVAPLCQVGSPSEQAGAEQHAHAVAVSCDMSVPYTVTYEDAPTVTTRSVMASSGQMLGRVAATITY